MDSNKSYQFELDNIQEDIDSERIGSRIKKIRKEQGLSQAELGDKVGLTANRIQQYENAARKPKFELTKQLADALNVDVRSILDPHVQDFFGSMFIFFEMEEYYNLKLCEKDGQIYLYFDEGNDSNQTKIINEFLSLWLSRKKDHTNESFDSWFNETTQNPDHDYNMWKWNFPRHFVESHSPKNRKKELQEKIKELEKELAKEIEKESNSDQTN
jgi:transcriptional regulator with XRE-family HTH domain